MVRGTCADGHLCWLIRALPGKEFALLLRTVGGCGCSKSGFERGQDRWFNHSDPLPSRAPTLRTALAIAAGRGFAGACRALSAVSVPVAGTSGPGSAMLRPVSFCLYFSEVIPDTPARVIRAGLSHHRIQSGSLGRPIFDCRYLKGAPCTCFSNFATFVSLEKSLRGGPLYWSPMPSVGPSLFPLLALFCIA